MRHSKIGAGMLFALLAAVSPAAATINLTGNFRADISVPILGQFTCSLDMVQAGTALSATGSCPLLGPNLSFPTGSINSASGAFTLSGSNPPICPTLSLAGTAAADSQSFVGTLTCVGPIPIGASVIGSRCGNGVVDPGEQCDDGNRNNGDCCSATCHYEAPGTVCGAGPNPCTTDACNGTGLCVHSNNTNACDDGSDCTTGDVCGGGSCHGAFVASGTTCDDSDPCTVGDQCDASGTCVPGSGTLDCGACMTCVDGFGCSAVGSVATSCKTPTAPLALLTLTDRPLDKGDRAAWTWSRGEATQIFDFGDPRTATGYKLCIYDQAFGDSYDNAILAAEIPAGGTCDGKPCWQGTRTGFKYKNKGATAGGIQAIVLKGGANGKARITIKGKGDHLQMPSLPLNLALSPILVQLQAANGQCWQAQYTAALKNTPLSFKARGGSPSGAFVE